MSDHLVIDVGNTRLKWGWLQDARLSRQQALIHCEADPEQWSKQVFDPERRPGRVMVSNVAGEAMARNLRRFSRETYGVEPEFIKPGRSFQELTSGYLDPALLGVDRWLAVIGAWNLIHGSLCVVDAGTAIKVDSVDAHGQHLGGLIVPGIQMMRESLLNRTHGIAPAMTAGPTSAAGILANDTVAAVTRGTVIAAASMADRAAQMVERSTGEHPQMLITGGDAELVMQSMQWPGTLVPDLVLQGIAAIARQGR